MQIGGHVGVEACVQEIRRRRGKRVCVNICLDIQCRRSKQSARDSQVIRVGVTRVQVYIVVYMYLVIGSFNYS